MAIEKAAIGGSIYSIITPEEFYKNPESNRQFTAIKNGDGYLYPVRNSRDMSKPGFYSDGNLHFFIPPTGEEEQKAYSEDNSINFSNAENLRELLKEQQRLRSEERVILTTIDNVFTPEISENDTPEMKALKEAIQYKGIDLDKYEQRFGPNYNNDKRLLRKGSITFGKMRTICDALDIKVTLTIEDMNPDVPNPIGKVITATVNHGLGSDVEEDEDV